MAKEHLGGSLLSELLLAPGPSMVLGRGALLPKYKVLTHCALKKLHERLGVTVASWIRF